MLLAHAGKWKASGIYIFFYCKQKNNYTMIAFFITLWYQEQNSVPPKGTASGDNGLHAAG